MTIILGAEEQYAYNESISNFLMLKIWHDLGIDVTNFSDFMAYPGGYYYAEPGTEIFDDGLKKIFPDCKILDYEDLALMKKIVVECNISSTPESIFILMNDKLRSLMETGDIEKLLGVISDQHGDLVEFEMIYHEKYGIVIALYYGGLFFELAMSVAEISKKIDYLSNQSKENSNGFYRKAV